MPLACDTFKATLHKSAVCNYILADSLVLQGYASKFLMITLNDWVLDGGGSIMVIYLFYLNTPISRSPLMHRHVLLVEIMIKMLDYKWIVSIECVHCSSLKIRLHSIVDALFTCN